MPPPTEIEERKQIIVEGRDAQEFFRALLKHMGVANIQVQDFGGVSELRGFLKALCNMPGFYGVSSLGIVRDAETNAASAFQSVCSALNDAKLTGPRKPLLPAGKHPQVTILILPDSKTPGMLETLCMQSVADDPVIECITRFFECINKRAESFPQNMPKAQVQAFLASRPKPGLLLGQAAHAGFWPWDSPAFTSIKRFVQTF